MVAALFVETGGCYFGLPNVDPWDEPRDARCYAGPYPVVAHPPCDRWHQLSAVNNKRWGYAINEDGGCFAAALAAIRRWGGVLEHPAESRAFKFHGSELPPVLNWQRMPGEFQIGWFDQKRPQLPKAERAATPHAFRDLLIAMARSAALSPQESSNG